MEIMGTPWLMGSGFLSVWEDDGNEDSISGIGISGS